MAERQERGELFQLPSPSKLRFGTAETRRRGSPTPTVLEEPRIPVSSTLRVSLQLREGTLFPVLNMGLLFLALLGKERSPRAQSSPSIPRRKLLSHCPKVEELTAALSHLSSTLLNNYVAVMILLSVVIYSMFIVS